MNLALRGAVSATVFAGLVSSSFGWNVLNPGGFTLMDNTGPGIPTDLGTVIASKTSNITGLDNNNNVIFTGFVYSTVVQYDGAGDLAFGFFLHNDATSRDPIERLTVKDFGGFATSVTNGDASFGPPTFPHSFFASRSNDGAVLGFNWVVGAGDGEILPGDEGRFVWIETDAKHYTDGELSAIDGGVGNTDTYAPAVPEPATMAFLGIGAMSLIRRRRNR